MAVTIPAARYTSSAFAALENHRLWPRVWQLACSLDHVADPGDFHELRIGPLSVLLVRGDASPYDWRSLPWRSHTRCGPFTSSHIGSISR